MRLIISTLKIQGMLAIAALFFACNSNSQQKSDFKNIASASVQKVIQEEKAILLDVRTPGEVQQGYIAGAEKFINFSAGNFESEILKLDKNKTYIVYCASGRRSAQAANLMATKGFKKVYNLEGGINSWTGEIRR